MSGSIRKAESGKGAKASSSVPGSMMPSLKKRAAAQAVPGPLFTFAALFGGVEVFGLAGLILGPLIMSVSFAILRIFAQDALTDIA